MGYIENAHFQRNVQGFSKMRHLCGCKDHRALTVGKQISDQMHFLDANRLRVENGRNPSGEQRWHKKPKTAKITKKNNRHRRGEFVLIILLNKRGYFEVFSVLNQ